MYEYFLILMAFLIVTFLLQRKFRIRLYRNWKECIEVAGLLFLIGFVWDTFAVWRGHWAFPPGNTLGITIGLLPVEEYLFFLIVPYFGLTLYKVIQSRHGKGSKD